MAKVSDFSSIRISLASPDNILEWSHGEVTKPETINYRTQKPEKDGLFCERIFGPEKDYECYCGKYRRIRYKGVVCDKCGVEVTRSVVRRERMGHIELAVPVAHIWFLRGVPSRMGLLLDIPVTQLERVIYYAAYIVTEVDEEKRVQMAKQIEEEFNRKTKELKEKSDKDTLKARFKEEMDKLKSLRPLLVLSEVAYHDLSLKYGEIFSAGTGGETVRNIFSNMDMEAVRKSLAKNVGKSKGAAQKKLQRRLSLVRRMIGAGTRPEWMFLTMLPVLPPEIRPMVQLDGGRYATSDLNDLYRRVINRNNRLKKLQAIKAPEVITRNEKRMLQESVDALIDNSARKSQTVSATTGGRRLLKSLADMLKGKQGRFRQNLLGKRVDYSGRSVIVVGPNLALHQCGLPKKMALELFRPFVIRKIIENEYAYNVRAANRLIEQAPPEVWALLEEVIEGKYVLLNRAPTLHRLGIQAFQPVLIEGDAIQLHPLVCPAFNADFDGDQMAVHVPLSEEAQKEAREIMLSSVNLLKPATGSPVVNPAKDMVLGAFWMSTVKEGAKGEGKHFNTFDDVVLAYDQGVIGLRAKIKTRDSKVATAEAKFVETTVGRILFSQILPEDFAFMNTDLTSNVLRDVTAELINSYSNEEAARVLDNIKKFGFEYATLSGISWAMDDLTVPKEKPAIIERARKEADKIRDQFNEGLLSTGERRNLVIDVWTRAKTEITDLVPKYLDKQGSVSMIIRSGARGSWSQPNQMAGMVGLVSNPAGQTIELPIEASFKEGFTALEYFISTHGARKGTADTALRTATAGYLTRRLVDVAQDVVVNEKNCRDKTGFIIYRAAAERTRQTLAEKIFGRILVKDVKGTRNAVLAKAGDEMTHELSKIISDDSAVSEVAVRSPLTCKLIRGLCVACYGWDLGHNRMVKMGMAAGIVAAQAIGEPGTQLTMRTFHTGGVAGGSDITQGLPRVEEIFEARPPKGRAIISEIAGVVEDIIEKDGERTIRIRPEGSTEETDEDLIEYELPANTGVRVEKGDLVGPSSQLTEGNLDLKEFYKYSDIETVQRHIVDSVQQIYISQGATIHDKHIEIIARQMFSRVQIDDSGDSQFSPGEILDLSVVISRNEKLKNKATYTTLLLGVTKVSLTTESFLSSASFQETARVLIEAAIEGRRDHLKGLKENVIIGKMIPAGTGFKVKTDK